MSIVTVNNEEITVSVSESFPTSLNTLTDVNITSPINNDHFIYNSSSGKWENSVSSGTGDVTGPSSSVDENITVFDSTTGKIIKDSGVNISEVTANTAKTGITSQQSTDITTNNAKNTNVSTNLTEGISTETTVDINSSDGTNATLVSASTLRAGLLTKSKFDEIVLNNAKVTNATHTGDVTGSTSLTIGVDKVLDSHINFGTGATQVSTADIPEQTNLYYTESRVTANTNVSSNTTHRGLTNNPHSVTSTQVGLGSVSNVATSDTAYNPTSWNTNLDSATKNAIRDKIETMDTAIGLNTSKVTNVSTNLSAGPRTATTMDVDSSDGTDATLVEADTTNAGILGSDKWDEIVANTLKVTNVSTNLSEGTSTNTTVDVNSSDGTNATLVAASTSRAGLLTKAKFDEIVVNTSASHAESHTILSHSDTTATGAELDTLTGGGDTTLHDHDGISENTSARHTAGTDTALGSGAVAADHGTDSTDQIINVSYGTSATPPTASTTTEGSLYVQYTA